MTGTPSIDILLATYNGAGFLAEQLDSLLAQSVTDWRVLARDDGSNDATVDILKRYAAAHLGRFLLIEDADSSLGACGNFGRLMTHAEAPYVMFCDQDDVWLPDKIERMMAVMRALEHEAGSNSPLLVHSDLKVVDSGLAELHPSFWEYQVLDPGFGRSLPHLLVQNVVTGCASLFNRPLLDLALPLPPNAAMHDWWVALVAVVFGRIRPMPESTVLYRQHGQNTAGARLSRWSMILRRGLMAPIAAVRRTRLMLERTKKQAAAFLTQYSSSLDKGDQATLERYTDLPQRGAFARRWILWHTGFLPAGFIRKLVFLVLV
jgi:glycosyltransferase involved in cell wall biosynthesis